METAMPLVLFLHGFFSAGACAPAQALTQGLAGQARVVAPDLPLHQWDYNSPANRDRIWGIFGTSDTLAHYEPLFLEHYTHAFHFPGAHTPTPDEVLRYYVPLVVQLIDRYATR